MNELEFQAKYKIDKELYKEKKNMWHGEGKYLQCTEHDTVIFNNGTDYCPVCITECIIERDKNELVQ